MNKTLDDDMTGELIHGIPAAEWIARYFQRSSKHFMTPTYWNDLYPMLDSIVRYVQDTNGRDEIILSNPPPRISFAAPKGGKEWVYVLGKNPQSQFAPDRWKQVIAEANANLAPMSHLLEYLNSAWKPGFGGTTLSNWGNLYAMLDDIMYFIQFHKGNALIAAVNAVHQDSESKIEFVSNLNKTWTCPIKLLCQGNNHPEKWKTIFLNAFKNPSPTVFLVDYLNNCWKFSSN